MVQAGRDLWRLSNPASCPKQASSRGKSSCSGLWAEGGESTDSLIPCFSNFPSFIVKMLFFFISLQLLSLILSFCSYKRTLASFSQSPFRCGRWRPNSSLSSSPLDWTSPVLSASLHAMLTAISPGCQQSMLHLICATYTQLQTWTWTEAPVTHSGMSELWTILARSRNIYILFSPRFLCKFVSILSVLCSFTSLQRTGFEGLSVAGRVFLFNVTVKYLRV